MRTTGYLVYILLSFLSSIETSFSQKSDLATDARQAMLYATRFMVEKVSTRGGYVRLYLPDFSRRWAELETYKSQIAIRTSGTTDMGNLFLDCYNTTGDEYYYEAAEKAVSALISGQLPCGGWDYIIDFAGVSSLKEWYNTIGKNAWGWDEYNHYYGTGTHKQNTTEAARFLLRMYLQKLDPKFKPALEKAIGFFVVSQYPLGGWPQRYPLKYDYPYKENRDYTSFYTFNDDITWENIEFLVQCYATLGEARLLDPIRRGMNFSLVTQQGNPQGGWAEQYDMGLKPANGRRYEPASLATHQTYRQVMLLMRFYQFTGDRKFLARIPHAIKWLESSRLPDDKTEGGKYTHPYFVEVGTNRPIYAHRKGTRLQDGQYWIDYNDDNPLLHYGAKVRLDINHLKEEYAKVDALTPEEATRNSPLKVGRYKGLNSPQEYFLPDYATVKASDEKAVRTVIGSLDDQHRWLSKNEWVSRPYTISATGVEANTAPFSTEGGEQIRDSTNQQYISTQVYLANMKLLDSYISSLKKDKTTGL
ncbi:MAG: Pectic acid lyase [Ferruginibacter sp.]|nr:Pectic acid lyase [Ferruginibacter sp.]